MAEVAATGTAPHPARITPAERRRAVTSAAEAIPVRPSTCGSRSFGHARTVGTEAITAHRVTVAAARRATVGAARPAMVAVMAATAAVFLTERRVVVILPVVGIPVAVVGTPVAATLAAEAITNE